MNCMPTVHELWYSSWHNVFITLRRMSTEQCMLNSLLIPESISSRPCVRVRPSILARACHALPVSPEPSGFLDCETLLFRCQFLSKCREREGDEREGERSWEMKARQRARILNPPCLIFQWCRGFLPQSFWRLNFNPIKWSVQSRVTQM